MKNKKWKQFGKLTEQCYRNMIGAEKDSSCWEKAFELLMEIVREERQKEPNCFQEVYMLDEATDYKYDISEWLEDCLDETDMREEYEVLLGMCDTLLSLFAWPDYTGSDLKFRKSSVLEALGRNNEAVSFCCKWFEKELENIMAATAYVYALIGAKEYEAAEKLIHQFIIDESECLEENEIMWTLTVMRLRPMPVRRESICRTRYVRCAEKSFTRTDLIFLSRRSWDSRETRSRIST